VEALVAEVRRYDAQDAMRVSVRIREVASLALYLDRVEAIHRDIVAAPRPASDHARELRALGRFLMQWLRRLGEGTIPENFDVLVAANKFAAEHQAMVAGATAMSDDNAALREQMGRLNAELKLVRHDFAAMHRANLVEVEALSNDNAVLRGELDVLRRELATLNRLHRSPHKLMRFYGGAIYRRIVGLGGN
jgi:hypothetical protein